MCRAFWNSWSAWFEFLKRDENVSYDAIPCENLFWFRVFHVRSILHECLGTATLLKGLTASSWAGSSDRSTQETLPDPAHRPLRLYLNRGAFHAENRHIRGCRRHHQAQEDHRP